MKILVTGTAGFIGFHLAEKLVSLGHSVIGIDNINDYYDVNLKYARLDHSGIKREEIVYGEKIASASLPGYSFIKLDLNDRENIFNLFNEEKFDCVCNLAAQAGVRYSLENPYSYIDSNIRGFLNILESCRLNALKHLVFASSSSVYGMNEKTPFSVTDTADKPASLYAATKRSNELMAYTYSRLYGIACTGLRFFTVYGPWGRPDMAYYKFTQAILNKKPIEVYNNGDMLRDFTYIDDIIQGIISAVNNIPSGKFALYNLGNNKPEKLSDFISVLENILGQKAEKIFLEMQAGDVPVTMADIDITRRDLDWEPKTSITEGLKLFAGWYLEYGKNGSE
ncbi:MAG: NAD-dependent epimerase/dehydratase family protein [Treponema sp.]|jgi:UDP-glucuronate 4-epimerase|nr:NAD-dependent epimerase/dehydratase family protein [Treponema sp.]